MLLSADHRSKIDLFLKFFVICVSLSCMLRETSNKRAPYRQMQTDADRGLLYLPAAGLETMSQRYTRLGRCRNEN